MPLNSWVSFGLDVRSEESDVSHDVRHDGGVELSRDKKNRCYSVMASSCPDDSFGDDVDQDSDLDTTSSASGLVVNGSVTEKTTDKYGFTGGFQYTHPDE